MVIRRPLIPLTALIATAALAYPPDAYSQYLAVTADAANIRTRPTTSSTVVVQAMKGDVFKLEGTTGAWYTISMFGGEYRYLHTSLARRTTTAPELPSNPAVRRQAFVAIVRAQDRAVREAERRYPSDFNRQIDLERLLYDRYELPILRRYGIPAARYSTLVSQGVRAGWVPK